MESRKENQIMTLFHWIIIFCLVLCKLTRCIILNIFNIMYYACRDAYEYIKYKRWKEFKEYGIDMPTGELDLLAERFALERGGRSARHAKQFIDGILAK